MRFYSTNSPQSFVSLKEAVFKGLPEDKGLYMPAEIPVLPDSFLSNLEKYSFQEIALKVSEHILAGTIPPKDLQQIIEKSITFPAPLVSLNEHIKVLELFHGPSLAFKDFGARFMAQLMSHLNKNENKELTILVATSGDTGGAVAAGFYKTPGINVIILYPSGKVSNLQEKQLTTLGHNIRAVEVKGTFDDCQALVKQAFLDNDIRKKIRLSSANSINISRLIPQSFYYFEALKQLDYKNSKTVFCVPSGNFGNLTAGLMAKKMGLAIDHFIAATNVNDVVPAYLRTGDFVPRTSVPTISNAMDVGNPSNFARMLDLFNSDWKIIKKKISGFAFTDSETRAGIREIYDKYHYVMDPHGSVGYLALKKFLNDNSEYKGIILETAHPSKFIEVVEEVLGCKINIPERLAVLANQTKRSTLLSTDFSSFKSFLLSDES